MKTLTYQNLANLQGLKEIKDKLDKYMTVIVELMREIHPSLVYSTLQFDIHKERYIIEQNTESYKIQTGFFWELNDLYFGIKVILTNDLDVMEDLVYDTGWSYGREGDYYSYFQLSRYADVMTEGMPTMAYFEILEYFKNVSSDSIKLIQLLERKRSKPTR